MSKRHNTKDSFGLPNNQASTSVCAPAFSYTPIDNCAPDNLIALKKEVIGKKIIGNDQVLLGVIDEVIFDKNNGKACYFVMSYGGFFGMGAKLLAIPWQALIISDNTNNNDINSKNMNNNKNNNNMNNKNNDKQYVLNVNTEKLLLAPSFDYHQWPNMNDEKWADSIHSFYGTHLKRANSIHSGM